MNDPSEHGLPSLRNQLIEMGGVAEELVRDAVRALILQDVTLAEKVIQGDDAVDHLEVEIEALCLRLMTLPLAIPDFRFVGRYSDQSRT